MQAHVVENSVILNTIEVDSLSFLPGLLDASLGGAIGDHQINGVFCKPIADLSKAKSLKNVQINQWREQSNGSSFVFAGKHIAAGDERLEFVKHVTVPLCPALPGRCCSGPQRPAGSMPHRRSRCEGGIFAEREPGWWPSGAEADCPGSVRLIGPVDAETVWHCGGVRQMLERPVGAFDKAGEDTPIRFPNMRPGSMRRFSVALLRHPPQV